MPNHVLMEPPVWERLSVVPDKKIDKKQIYKDLKEEKEI